MSFEEFWISKLNEFSNSESLCRSDAPSPPLAPTPTPVKFRLDPTWFWMRSCLMNFKVAAWRLSWILERNDFSSSESLCPCDASHQVLAQSDLWFGRRYCLKNFKVAAWRPSWISERNDFSNSESLFYCDASH